ncbi:Ig-like domain-containing protein [Myxococcus sp. CA039A]|uniref:Ig-like domain-containing protein n=1 Tax=Myxococcus sp. CA039A TaxID=2741737 RepID=UPI00157AD3A1|nr:Ig-like domain-containing protein [Myxococcus sp. CA039A]NTX50869.1 Ig-like domain-containing protein [Myxococcus sp. CA039A]
MRCALAVLGLWAFTPGCKNAAPGDEDPPISMDGEPDAGGSDGGVNPDGGPVDGGPQTSDGVGFIDYTLPSADMEAVPLNARVIVAFTEVLEATSVSATSLTLSENGMALEGAVSHDAATHTLSFVPARPFTADSLVTVAVSTGLRTVTGRSLPAPHVFVFSVGKERDTTPPTVLTTLPLDNAAGVAPTRPVYVITFREPMDPRSLTAESLRFEQVLGANPAAPLSGVISYEPRTQSVYFRTSPAPAPGAHVTGALSTQAKDLAGNALVAAYSFSFAVTASRDTSPPRVLGTLPVSQTVGVAVRYAPFTVSFDEPLRPESVTTDSVYLEEQNEAGTQAVRRVAGTVRYDDARLQAAFSPSAPLKYQTRYRGRARAVEDLAGNPLGVFNGFDFITELPPAPPTVRGAVPAPDMRFVSLGGPLRVSFDRPLDPATVNAASFGVEGVNGLVNYEASTNTVVFRPVPPFAPATDYTVTVKDVRTPQGASLASPFTYALRTVASRTKVSADLPGQPSLPAFATGPLGTLAVWSVDTGTSIQVRAAFDTGAGFADSTVLGEAGANTLPPEVSSWGNRFIISWSDAWALGKRVMLFDGTSFTSVTPNVSGDLFGLGNNLYVLNGKTFRVLNGTQWTEVHTSPNLGSPILSLLLNGDSILVSSGWGTSPEVAVVFDGARWSESSVTSNVDAQYIRVGTRFGRAWVSSRGTEFALFNPDTHQWSAPELISSTQASSVRIASDGNTITAVFGASSGLFGADRVNGTWQPAVLLESIPVRELWALVRHHGNSVALWSSTATQLHAAAQTGGSWASASKGVVTTGANRVRDVRAAGDDLLVLTERNNVDNSAYEIWGTALTSQGWRPSVRLRGMEKAGARLAMQGARVGAVFAAPGLVALRAYLGSGQWEESHPLVTPELVGSVRNPSVHFAADGHGAAAWEQFEAGAWSILLAEFDGTAWHEPVRVARGGSRPRVAVDDNLAVVAYLHPGTTGNVEAWMVTHEAGVPGTPLKLDSVAATYANADLALTHGASGFMAVWGDLEIRSAQSVDGQTWSAPVTASPRAVSGGSATRLRLVVPGTSFAVSVQRGGSSLSASVHAGGAWQTRADATASNTAPDFAADASTVMLLTGFENEFRYLVHNGTAWSAQRTLSSPADGKGLLAASPQGLRLHTGMSWWKWSGSEWVKEATQVSRPHATGSLRCDTKGCGLATGPVFGTPVNLALSYAPGTSAFQQGASPHEPSQPVIDGSVSWDFAAGSYRATWLQPAQQGVHALHASTGL